MQVSIDEGILNARVEIPDTVVFRRFVAETVILNLSTGRYHGVNPTGGFMLELLDKHGNVREAASLLAAQYGLALEEATRDLCEFCTDLEQRELIVLHPAS